MKKLFDLKIKIFADGANKVNMIKMYNDPLIKGLTTNPSLMKKEGISDYASFCKDILKNITNKPISFEVFSDDFSEMKRQALEIASWGDNVFVKIPITNTKKESSYELIKELSNLGVKLNVTAIMTIEQVQNVITALNPKVRSYISIFAGRIADTGVDPVNIVKSSLDLIKPYREFEIIWASPRELLNIFQANDIGCQIITVTNDILKKLSLIGYNLDDYSLDTVKMFYSDAKDVGYKI